MIDRNQYLTQRIDDQIAWYDRRSRENRHWYTRLRILSIVISLSIPVLAGSIDKDHNDDFKIIISIAGALVALIEGLMSLRKYHELWTEYRATSEGLKYHRYLFETGAAPYDMPDCFRLFVQNAEGIMATERTKWIQIAKQQATPPQLKDAPEPPIPAGQTPDTTDDTQPGAGTPGEEASSNAGQQAPAGPSDDTGAPEADEEDDDGKKES